MVDRNLIREFQIDESSLDAVLSAALEQIADSAGEMDHIYDQTASSSDPNQMVDGRVLGVPAREFMPDFV